MLTEVLVSPIFQPSWAQTVTLCGGVAVCGSGPGEILAEHKGIPRPRVGRNGETLLEAIAEAALASSPAPGSSPELSEPVASGPCRL